MVRSVLENQIDFAIVGRIEYDHKLEVIPFMQNELVLLVAPGHRLCSKKSVRVEDLADENLILREQGSGTRRLVEKALSNTEILSTAYVESGNVDFIKELVAMGNGVTLLACMGADSDVDSGSLVMLPFEGGAFSLDIDIVINKERPLSNADILFLDYLLEDKSDPHVGYNYSGLVRNRGLLRDKPSATDAKRSYPADQSASRPSSL